MNKVTSEMVANVLFLAHKISTHSVHDVFVEYAPHCDQINVSIYEAGYHSGSRRVPVGPNEDQHGTIYLDSEYHLLALVILKLEQIAEESCK